MVNTIETDGIETQVDSVAHSFTRHYPHFPRVDIVSMKNSPFSIFASTDHTQRESHTSNQRWW